MKFLFIIALLGAASLLDEAEISNAFESFVREYERTYNDEYEKEYRKQIFADNYLRIKELNEGDDNAYFEVNQFADMSEEEFEAEYLDPRGVNEKCTVAQKRVWDNPTDPVDPDKSLKVDWVKKGVVSEVKNQGRCGSCWTFATISVVETMYAIREKKLLQFSEQQVVDCCRKSVSSECKISNGCKGGLVGEGFQYLINKGTILETDYPYKARDEKCKYKKDITVFKPHSYVDITPSDLKAMEKILVSRSFAVGLAANHPAFRFYRRGVVSKNCPETPLNHGVTVVGAGVLNDEPYWLVRNSWGKRWGDGGYLRISRSLKNYPTGVCGIASCPEYVKYKE